MGSGSKKKQGGLEDIAAKLNGVVVTKITPLKYPNLIGIYTMV